MSIPETFTYTVEVPLADADGKPISEGSVLREIKDGEQGVVTRVIRKGDTHGPMASQVGDMLISMGHGTTRVTNRYNQWRHVPHSEQTYSQRLLSWKMHKYDHDADRSISADEGRAIDGIMRLLPEDTVNWDYGPWPDTIEDALGFLSDHLTEHCKKATP